MRISKFRCHVCTSAIASKQNWRSVAVMVVMRDMHMLPYVRLCVAHMYVPMVGMVQWCVCPAGCLKCLVLHDELPADALSPSNHDSDDGPVTMMTCIQDISHPPLQEGRAGAFAPWQSEASLSIARLVYGSFYLPMNTPLFLFFPLDITSISNSLNVAVCDVAGRSVSHTPPTAFGPLC